MNSVKTLPLVCRPEHEQIAYLSSFKIRNPEPISLLHFGPKVSSSMQDPRKKVLKKYATALEF